MSNLDEFRQKLVDGVFHVDHLGHIWRLKTVTRSGALLPIEPRRAEIDHGRGYRSVRLGKSRSVMAHQAVFLAFHGEMPPGNEVNHINGDRSDNHPSNLEAVTRSENNQHSWSALGRKPLTGAANGRSKLTDDQADYIRRQKGRAVAAHLAREVGISKHAIYAIWQGRSWRPLSEV